MSIAVSPNQAPLKETLVGRWSRFLVYTVVLFCLTSRGFFELVAGKAAGYGVQIFVWSLFLLLTRPARGTGRYWSAETLFLYTLFAVSAFVSALNTEVEHNFDYGLIYCFAMLYIAGFFLYGIEIHDPRIDAKTFMNALALIGFILIVFGTLQEFKVVQLPGASGAGIVRPASLTGSYLHYPIVIAIMCFIFLEASIILKANRYILLSLLCTAAIFISESRSGAMIVGMSIMFWFLLNFATANTKVRIQLVFAAALLTLLVVFLIDYFSKNIYVDRVLSAIDTQSIGNESRIYLWNQALDIFTSSPLFFGSQTGIYTNITGNFTGERPAVVESGFLQQLVNFGILGTATFYLLFAMLAFAIDRRCVWLRAAALGALSQSFVYQSIEVLPFIAIVAYLPVLSRALVTNAAFSSSAPTSHEDAV